MVKKKIEKVVIERGYEPIKRRDGGWSYRCQVSINRQIIRRTFKNIKDARVWKNKQLSTREENRANGIKYHNGMFFSDLCIKFLATRVGAKDSTKKAYTSTIRTHLSSRYGNVQIKSIKKNTAIMLQGELEANHHSPGGINKIIALFTSIIDFAVKMEYLEKNPLKGIKRLKVDDSDYQYWLPEQIKDFLRLTKNNEFFNVFSFALNTGLRRGEICGLLWKNVTIKDGVGQLIYNQQLMPNMERGLVKGHSTRSVSLSPGAVKILESIERRGPDDYVFLTKRGTPCPPNTITMRWKQAQKDLGWKVTMKLHGARHSFASFLAAEGVSMKKIQHSLGHKDGKVTDRYSHLNIEDEREAVKIVDF